MRIVFFGTPQFSVPALDACTRVGEVVGVVTRPDKPSGRGMQLKPPPVKQRAQELGIPVLQPKGVRKPEFLDQLRDWSPDVAVVIAYGRILPASVLELPMHGCINVHASLLPRWRGAAPIQWAIAHGDAETGVCLMHMDEGLDTGPVYTRKATPITSEDTGESLTERLSQLSATLLDQELQSCLDGTHKAQPQNHDLATLAPILTREHGHIRWNRLAESLPHLIRAMHPWPGTFTVWGNKRIKIFAGSAVGSPLGKETSQSDHPAPGTVLSVGPEGVTVQCADGKFLITDLQLEGKRRMGAQEAAPGLRSMIGNQLI